MHTCILTLGGGGRGVKGSSPCSAVSSRPDRATGAHVSKQNRTATKKPTTKTSTAANALNPTIWIIDTEDDGYVDQPRLPSKFHTSKGYTVRACLKIKLKTLGWRDDSTNLKVFAALPEDMSLFPAPMLESLQVPATLAPGDPTPTSGLYR